MGWIAEIFDEGGSKLFEMRMDLERGALRGRCDVGAPGVAASWRIAPGFEGPFDRPYALEVGGTFAFEIPLAGPWTADLFKILVRGARAAPDPEPGPGPPRAGYKYGGLL